MAAMAGCMVVEAAVEAMRVPAIRAVELVAVGQLVAHMVDPVAMADINVMMPHREKMEQIPLGWVLSFGVTEIKVKLSVHIPAVVVVGDMAGMVAMPITAATSMEVTAEVEAAVMVEMAAIVSRVEVVVARGMVLAVEMGAGTAEEVAVVMALVVQVEMAVPKVLEAGAAVVMVPVEMATHLPERMEV